MSPMTRAVIGVVVTVGLAVAVVPALLEEAGALELTVLAETLVEQEGIELSGRVRRVARGVGTCNVQEEWVLRRQERAGSDADPFLCCLLLVASPT